MNARFFQTAVLVSVLLAGCGRPAPAERTLPDDGKRPLVVAMTGADERTGSDAELALARRIAARMGRGLRAEMMPFEFVLPSVREGKADFAVSFITITEKRARDVDFSTPYASGGAVFLYQAGGEEPSMIRVEGHRVGVVGNTTLDTYLCDHGIDPVRFEKIDSAVAELKEGRLYAILYDRAMIAGYANDPSSGLKLSRLETRENYGVAVNKGRKDILAAANAVIGGAE